jgi:hypothetical protein
MGLIGDNYKETNKSNYRRESSWPLDKQGFLKLYKGNLLRTKKVELHI